MLDQFYSDKIAPLTTGRWYVYAAYVDGEIRYVGRGSGQRYLHCSGGKSSCLELNRDYFKGKKIEVHKVFTGLSECESKEREALILLELKGTGIYNKNFPQVNSGDQSFVQWVKQSLKLVSSYSVGDLLHVSDASDIFFESKFDFYFFGMSCQKTVLPLLGFIKTVEGNKHYWKRVVRPKQGDVFSALKYYWDKDRQGIEPSIKNTKSLLDFYVALRLARH